MKPLFILTLILLKTSLLFSQSRLGFKLGYHVSEMKFTSGLLNTETKSAGSFHATVLMEMPLKKMFYLQPGISILQKGSILWEGNSVPLEIYPVYIEMPINLISKVKIGKGNIFFGGGAYGAVGVVGSVVTNEYINGWSTDHSISYGSDATNDLKKFDFGANLIAGYELNENFNLGVGYSLGLHNISTSPNKSLKNRVLSFSVGIMM